MSFHISITNRNTPPRNQISHPPLLFPSPKHRIQSFKIDPCFLFKPKLPFHFPLKTSQKQNSHSCSISHKFVLKISKGLSARGSDDDSSESQSIVSKRTNNTILYAASIVGISALLSKILGFVREYFLANLFGVGPVTTAYSYSGLVPGFCLTLLGGVNGPFHSSITTVLSKVNEEEGQTVINQTTFFTILIFGFLSFLVLFNSNFLIEILAPGLNGLNFHEGILAKKIAIYQLQIMSPCILLSPLIGIGFGKLTFLGEYFIPSFSPSLSNISIIFFLIIFIFVHGRNSFMADSVLGGIFLALGATFGSFFQFFFQLYSNRRKRKMGSIFSTEFFSIYGNKNLKEVLKLIIPSVLSSGVIQFATVTDLYFASFLPGAAAALGYANLLAMSPIGILSSSLLVPILPLFAKNAQLPNRPKLKENIIKAIVITLMLSFCMMSIFIPLALPISNFFFQNKFLNSKSTNLVSSLFICYLLGSPFYLGREILVRVFYALGNAQIPFLASLVAIFGNLALDFLAVKVFNLGSQGLVLATSFMNALSTFFLFYFLFPLIDGLDMRPVYDRFIIIIESSLICLTFTHLTYSTMSKFVFDLIKIQRFQWISEVFCLGFVGFSAFFLFFSALVLLGLPEAKGMFRDVKLSLGI